MSLFSVLMLIAMLAVLLVLIIGIVGMAKGGDFNKKYANLLMRWRVGLQAVALILFIAAMAVRAKGGP